MRQRFARASIASALLAGALALAPPLTLFAQAPKCEAGTTLEASLAYYFTDVTYTIADPSAVTAAWVEYWVGSVRKDRVSIPAVASGSTRLAGRQERRTSDLLVSVFDADGSSTCDLDCEPGFTAGPMSIGGIIEDEYYEEARADGAARVVANTRAAHATVIGQYFTVRTRVDLFEREIDDPPEVMPPGRSGESRWRWRARIQPRFIDSGHLDLPLEPALVARPTWFLAVAVDHNGPDTPSEVLYENPLSRRSQVIVVVGQDSPTLERFEPARIRASNTSTTTTVTVRGSGFTATSAVVTGPSLLVEPINDPQRAWVRKLPTTFVSSTELRVSVDGAFTHGLFDGSAADALSLTVWNDWLRQSESRELEVSPGAGFVKLRPSPEITSVAPFPMDALNDRSPRRVPITIKGKHFRRQHQVIATIGVDRHRLQVDYVSARELRAWLPRELYLWNEPTYRLVVERGRSACAVEVTGGY